MSLHVAKKILALGTGSQLSHIISRVAVDAPFPKPVCYSTCIQVLNLRKVGLKMSLKRS